MTVRKSKGGLLRTELEQTKEREVKLRSVLSEFRDHVGTVAPLTWASTNDLEYIELAHEWEKQWKVLDDKVTAVLKVTAP